MSITPRSILLACSALAVLSLSGVPASGQDAAALQAVQAPENAVWLDSLDLSKVDQGWGQPQAGHSVDKHPLRLHAQTFPHGLGTHADSELWIDLKGAATKFVSLVGVDDEVQTRGSVSFEVWVDGKQVADSGLLRGGQAPKLLSVDVQGAQQMVLIVSGGGGRHRL